MVRVTVTGSGTPIMVPGRAGPGVLVEVGADVKLQFDTGRATALRLTEAGVKLPDLTAVFLTHHHSDHMVGLPDLAMSYWLEQAGTAIPLEVVAPRGPAADYAAAALDIWRDEMTIRAAHTGRDRNATISVSAFTAGDRPQTVFETGEVKVSAVAVRHEPIVPAVAYRVDTPGAGSVVVSGDTAVCPTLESLAHEATVLVQEVFRSKAVPEGLLSDSEAIASYHSDVTEVGEMADRAGVGTLLLTHVIPPPASAQDKVDIINDIRRAGYRGPVIVADDLDHVDFSRHSES